MSRLNVMVFVSLFLALNGVLAATPGLDQGMKSTHTLITKSSIAKQVLASQNTEAKSLQQQAKEYFEKARKASEAGDKETAKKYINKAKMTMFEAGQQLGNEKSASDKASQEFKHRYENVKSLLMALQRINEKNGRSQNGNKIEQDIKTKMENAQLSFDGGQVDKAQKIIDTAFLTARSAIIDLRDGDTLVRSLNFANKEEEYRYELDRNDTHKMLVSVLLSEKMKNPKTAARVKENMDKAENLRTQAEQLAKAAKFSDAVETLEKSTKQIIRAIRAAGVYIPG